MATTSMISRFMTPFLILSLLSLVLASPTLPSLYEPPTQSLRPRQEPYFPDTPASCPICAQGYDGINSCAAAAPVLANFTEVIFDPGAFIDVIKCACTDTFQSAYPQCVDCFTQTNQTQFLNISTGVNASSLIVSIRNICALESTLLGNVSETNGEAPATSTTSAAFRNVVWGGATSLVLLGLSIIGLVYSI